MKIMIEKCARCRRTKETGVTTIGFICFDCIEVLKMELNRVKKDFILKKEGEDNNE